MKDRKTLKFGSMGEMRDSGLATVAGDGKIEMIFHRSADLLKFHCLRLADLFETSDKSGSIPISDGICVLPPGVDFRGKNADTWRVVVSGEDRDEVFYLILSANMAQPIDGGIIPEGVSMDVYFKDGCGRPGLEGRLYHMVADRLELLLDLIEA